MDDDVQFPSPEWLRKYMPTRNAYDYENGDDFANGYTEEEHDMTNRLRNAAIILDETITTIQCRFNMNSGEYTFLCKKELARELKEGQAVLGQKTDSTIVVLYFVSADEESDINLETEYKYCFVFQTVDHVALAALNDHLNKSEKHLKQQQRMKLREQVKNDLVLEYKQCKEVRDDVV